MIMNRIFVQIKHILGGILLLLISIKGFSQPVAPAFGNTSLAPFTTPNLTSFVIDYNNDGIDDLVGYTFQYANTGKLWKNNGNGTFSDVSSTVAFSNYNWTGAFDFDRNGLMDVYQLNGDTLRISFNTAAGFTTPDANCGYYLLSDLFGVTANDILNPILGDYDGDGVYDIISQIISGTSSKINAVKGQLGCVNGCFFRFPSQTPFTLISLANTTNSLVKLADIDNDFDMDLLIGRGTQYQNYAYSIYKKSSAGYTLFSGSGYDIGRKYGFGILGDFNNDGITDIVSGAEDCCVVQGDVLYVYYSNPNGTFTANSSVMTRVNGEDPYYYRATVLDINLDKTQDIIWTDMSAISISKTQVFLNDNFNTFVESSSPMNLHNGYTDGLCCPITLFTRATILDINNDKKPDVHLAQIDELTPFSITNNWQRINTTTNNSVKLKLIACNGLKEGWGARIRYKVGGVWYYQQHNAYNSSGYPFLYLGMGAATSIETIEVTWFGGAVTTASGINAGEFKVMEENANCTNDALSSFSVNTMPDTSTNCGTSVTLAGPSGFASYSWNNGATTQSINATANGFYKLTVTNNSGCKAYDSTYLSIVKSDILQNNSTICKGSSVLLSIDSSFAAQNLSIINLLPSNLKAGLKAYYPFSGNANDVSGNNNNGTVNGATLTADRFGNANSAYAFNGSSFIDLGNIAGVGYSTSQDITMSFWINEGASGTVISKYTNLDAPNSNFFMSKSVSAAQLAGNGTNSITANNLIDYRWTNYVFIAASGTNKSFLYRNGVLVATGTLNANGTLSATKLMLGKLMGSPSNFFTGKIDDVFIYNRALTVAEIAQLSNFQPKVTWSNGATTNTISVTPTATTKYYATISDGITSCMDSVTVTVDDIGSFNPFPTQSSTCGITKVLDAGAGFASYLWNTGATSQTILPTINGEYIVTVTNAAGCSASDTVIISLIKADIIQTNQTVCAGTTINLFIDSTFSGSVINAKSQMSANLQTGLVAYYPFNGNASDISGNNNVLTANGVTLTTDRFGRSNSAYSFTNTQTSVTNYLKAVNPSPFAKNTYTISAWFNSRQFYPNIGGVTYNYQSIVFYSPQWYNYGPAYHLALQHANNSVLEGGNWTTTNTNQGVTTANGSIVVNQWYHVVLSYDGTTIKMYKDGQLVGSRAATISYANQIQFLIGGAGDGPNPGGIYGGFNGKIDDVGFWDRALTLNEIQELYSGRPSVLWSISETSNKISVTPAVTTKYYATLTDGIASCTDSVTITVDNIAGFNPLQDTVKICGDSTILDAGTGFATYNWSNGSTTRTISAKASGKYFVNVASAAGCSASDTSFVSIVKAKILQRDTTICKGSSLTLAIDSSFSGRSVCNKSDLPINLQNGLVAYYPFCGNANDVSGNNHNGSVVGATLTNDRFGNINSAYYFNGQNNFIRVAHTNELNLSSDFSLSCWFLSEVAPTYRTSHTLLAKRDDRGACCSPNVPWHLSINYQPNILSDYKKPLVTSSKNGSYKYIQASKEISINYWHNIIITYSLDTLKMYLDGKIIHQEYFLNSSRMSNTSDMLLGAINREIGAEYLQGKLDDIFIYNRSITQSEISQLVTSNYSNATWSTGATTPSIVVNPTVKTTYKVTVTDGITTCTDSVVVDVSSSELKVTDPAAVCSPGVVNLTAASVTAGSAAGLTYTYWKDSTATQALVNPDKVSVSGTYYIVGTSSTGCTSAPTAVKVTINPLPVATIVTPTQTTICDKSTISLTATGGTSYQWLLNGSVIAGATSSTYAASLAGSYEVNVIALGCTTKVAAPVNLSLITAAVPKFSNSSTCIDVPVSFFNETDTTTSGSVSWLWDFGDGQTSTIFNPVYTYKKSGAFIVKLTVTPKLCSSLSSSITKNITVDVPPVGIKYPNVLAVKNKATPLSARFIANGYTYFWMPSSGLNNGAIQNPVFNASIEQLYRVRLTSPGGCITMDTVKVSVYDSSDIFVPKAFTPNKDGKNDLLQPFLVNITTLKFFRVYNRWGQLMFQSSDSKQGWDGMYNYKPQPLETYTWIAEGIDGNGTTIFRKGQTVLIR
jgi:gliding motility-associated-like protein